ncbi:NUDIX hydrolase [Phenylobacterium deserti]|uniref:DNA mismatch repair protein MutT n=1 Tax=Phenylobacterium deserti TaxID=1914756 RepID=A0A328AR93_9CAUL|nr:NUDIX hydrolase [Phenylobacterium deserti]RAK56815.1 DNA mismatch repair protein MutT [Phenylobacterium deserti]
MAKKDQVPAEPDREPRQQYAALPWRRAPGGDLEVLLITSRETRRWVIPKGWPIKGLKSPQSAAREALEEAGVEGETGKSKLGIFHYDKKLRSGRVQKVRVAVYSLQVTHERESWKEKDQREKLWTTPEQAASLVEEPELRALIAAFAP